MGDHYAYTYDDMYSAYQAGFQKCSADEGYSGPEGKTFLEFMYEKYPEETSHRWTLTYHHDGAAESLLILAHSQEEAYEVAFKKLQFLKIFPSFYEVKKELQPQAAPHPAGG